MESDGIHALSFHFRAPGLKKMMLTIGEIDLTHFPTLIMLTAC